MLQKKKTDSLKSQKSNAIIVGAGPAGIACAIQLKRYGIEPIIFEKNEPGGLLVNANLVENYPGFTHGIKGTDLVINLREHLDKYELYPEKEEVLDVNFNNKLFEIKTNISTYETTHLVIATGTVSKTLDIGQKKVFYEVCELYKQKINNKKIAIIGSGDAAFDYALNLANHGKASSISILNRSEDLKCLSILKRRALKHKKINYIENIAPENAEDYDFVLAAIGRLPNTSIINKLQPNTPNLYLIGDVKNGSFRQTAIAVGDGIRAAMEICGDFPS